jgi:hypothetical protein
MIAAFFVWEFYAPHPMVPRAMFHKAKKTMVVILLITWLSGGNFFALLLFYPTQIYNVYGTSLARRLWTSTDHLPGDDPIGVGLRSLPIGFGIIIGAFICLVLIPITKGRIRLLMIFFTAVMTAGTGAMSISTPHNMGTIYGIVTLAALGVGGVIIPSSIIAQIACPDELIATVTAITLSLRYIGGAIAFAVYSNIFYAKIAIYAKEIVAVQTLAGQAIINPLRADGVALIAHVTDLAANAQFDQVREILATNPLVLNRDGFGAIVAATQEAFALAYRWPYWISIAFGAACFIASFFVGDIGALLDGHVAAAL